MGGDEVRDAGEDSIYVPQKSHYMVEEDCSSKMHLTDFSTSFFFLISSPSTENFKNSSWNILLLHRVLHYKLGPGEQCKTLSIILIGALFK